jgi:ABC-2 type transport system permease protein
VFREPEFGAVNWVGFWTLYLREVRRFVKVYTQTLLAPVATTLLFLAVFLLAMNGRTPMANYSLFLAPGLIMMAMTQNAFANTSSSVLLAKVQGTMVDILMPPLSAAEVTLALVLGGATRGVAVGVVVGLSMLPFVPLTVEHWGLVLFHGIAASVLLSTVGVLGGLWSEKFDHIAAVTNFVVTPLSFLSGTFYSIDRLHFPFDVLARLDPFFYMIDGFRSGFTGQFEAPPMLGIAVMTALNAILLVWCWWLFKIGYRIKS